MNLASSRDGKISRIVNNVIESNDRSNTNEHEVRPRTASSRDALTVYDEDDVNENAAEKTQCSDIERLNTATSQDYREIGDTPIDSRNDIDDGTGNSPERGEDNPVPGMSEDGMNEKANETSSPRGGKFKLRVNPTPNFTDEYR